MHFDITSERNWPLYYLYSYNGDMVNYDAISCAFSLN